MGENLLKENLDGIREILDDSKPLKIQRIYHRFFKTEESDISKDEQIASLRETLAEFSNSRDIFQEKVNQAYEEWSKGIFTKTREALSAGRSPVKDLQTRFEELMELNTKLDCNNNYQKGLIENLQKELLNFKIAFNNKDKELEELRMKINKWMTAERKNISEEVWEEMRGEGSKE